jgi:hypothetical protein
MAVPRYFDTAYGCPVGWLTINTVCPAPHFTLTAIFPSEDAKMMRNPEKPFY